MAGGGSSDAATEFFDGLKDHEFFSGKVSHVYLYDEVSTCSFANVQQQVRAALDAATSSRGVRERPKPIVIHLNSPGGDSSYGLSLMNLLSEIPVPFAVCVDGYAASAATPMLVAAPYRVMMSTGMVMIHGSFAWVMGKAEDLAVQQKLVSLEDEHYRKAYISNTRLGKAALDELLARDKFLGADDCVKYDIVDRVLQVDRRALDRRFATYYKTNPDYDRVAQSAGRLLWKTNFNHLQLSSSDSEEVARSLAAYNHSDQQAKPLIVHATSKMLSTPNLYETLPFFAGLYMLSAPSVGVIKNDVNIVEALPILACHRRYMYDTCHVYVHLVYMRSSVSTFFYYDDIVDNYALYKEILRSAIAKMCPRAPKSFLDGLFKTRAVLTARDCLALGLVDGVVSPVRRKGELVGCKFKDCAQIRKRPAR